MRIRILLVILLVVFAVTGYSVTAYLKQFNFDEPRPLDKWDKMVLNGLVDYKVMRQGSNGFVDALSEKTCSALYYKIGFRLKDYPMLSWKWQVKKFPDKRKALTDRQRDDYAARVYVIFPFLSFSTSKFIEYVWDENLPAGAEVKSPSGRNVKTIVARSGKGQDGKWYAETRNVYEDYRRVFGKVPGMGAGAIAIMCNADNTKSGAEAMFDEIVISAAPAGSKQGDVKK